MAGAVGVQAPRLAYPFVVKLPLCLSDGASGSYFAGWGFGLSTGGGGCGQKLKKTGQILRA